MTGLQTTILLRLDLIKKVWYSNNYIYIVTEYLTQVFIHINTEEMVFYLMVKANGVYVPFFHFESRRSEFGVGFPVPSQRRPLSPFNLISFID